MLDTIVLGIDLETTGLEPEQGHKIVEVACVLYNATKKHVIRMFSDLCWVPDDTPLDGLEVSGITYQELQIYGKPWELIEGQIYEFERQASYFVAHNAEFEQKFLASHRVNTIKPWIDTYTDLPSNNGNAKLTVACAEHDIFATGRKHRALQDTLLMLELLAKYDIQDVILHAISPVETIVISFPYDDTGMRQRIAKSLGYRWDSARKWWVKSVKDFQVEAAIEDSLKAGFKPQLLQKEAVA